MSILTLLLCCIPFSPFSGKSCKRLLLHSDARFLGFIDIHIPHCFQPDLPEHERGLILVYEYAWRGRLSVVFRVLLYPKRCSIFGPGKLSFSDDAHPPHLYKPLHDCRTRCADISTRCAAHVILHLPSNEMGLNHLSFFSKIILSPRMH